MQSDSCPSLLEARVWKGEPLGGGGGRGVMTEAEEWSWPWRTARYVDQYSQSLLWALGL